MPMKNDDILKRLRIIEGHLKGITRMVESDAYCIDIIRQIQAVQASLNKINSKILEQHLNSCVVTAVRGELAEEREKVLKEIGLVFEASMKV